MKLNNIINFHNLKHFFLNYKHIFSRKYLRDIKTNLLKFLKCRDPKYGYLLFKCSTCTLKAFRPFSCKSRFCPSCGKLYSIKWTEKLSAQLIDKPHRHVIFTIPETFREYFVNHRELLSLISDKLYSLFKEIFLKNRIRNFGFISIFHTFGRDIKFNPHLHILFTEGGFNDNLLWKKCGFFHWKLFANSWKYIITSTLAEAFPDNQRIKNLISLYWKNEKQFFFNIQGNTINNPKGLIKYLGRYLARPAIAEYRILNYDGSSVTFWYEDLESRNKVTLTLPINEFIGRLVSHIPPKNFKMVRRYGLYARNIKSNLKVFLNKFKTQKLFKIKKNYWEELIYRFTGKNPLICPSCNIKMTPYYFYHEKYGEFYFPTWK